MMIVFFGQSLLVILLVMTVFYLAALRLRDNSIVDIAWGLGVAVVAWFGYFAGSSGHWRQILVTVMATLWGMRLGIYILLRKRGKGEDFRYQVFRKKWGKQAALKSFFYIFMFQGLLQFMLSMPVLTVLRSADSRFGVLDAAGAGLFVLGLGFESIADWQKYRFKQDPAMRGKLMTTGLWRYSRHPNYFGEVILWWGIFLVALSVPGGWAAVISPLLVTWLLLFFSGIPLLEKSYEGREDFLAYKRKTPAFFPWFPAP